MTLLTIEALVERAHTNSAKKGFWNEFTKAEIKGDETALRALINEKLLLVVSEITEAMEELRSGHTPQEIYKGDAGKPEGFGVEIADALIRMFDLVGGLDLPIGDIISQKMGYNSESRGHMHGRQF
ncbi:nucleotide pyrophosphohydrolase [Brevibacterium phage Cantare]|uniref:Nucleotide pyrophosphohydrolase n=1 Tax=Brevibacterium phage Cantare TaxID=2338395 RepID=A0A3G3LYS3_9CAUD|nr:pyrophosphatase [Brevibacterium phage Cantare]AYQ99271.1 nucleotide pyrophosphohydrolase [Brevibacterium phage Cantare]